MAECPVTAPRFLPHLPDAQYHSRFRTLWRRTRQLAHQGLLPSRFIRYLYIESDARTGHTHCAGDHASHTLDVLPVREVEGNQISEHELCLTRIAYLDIDRGRIKKATMTIAEIITISPNVQSGEPVFTETRVPVRNLFDYLKAGDTTEEFLRDFPSVKKEQVVELLNFFENIFNIRTKEHENNFA